MCLISLRVSIRALRIHSLRIDRSSCSSAHSQLLSLSSKAAQDLLDASDVANCREVLSEGADHCAALLSATDFSTTDRQTLKHVVLHYCLRIKVETQSGHYAIAGFVKTQVQSLLPKLSDKEVSIGAALICNLAS